MRWFRLNKLVRDGVYDNMLKLGQKPQYRRLDDEELLVELKNKIIEEAREFNPKDSEGIGELADIAEALEQLAACLGYDSEQLKKAQIAKRKKAGSFSKRTYVAELGVAKDDKWAEYYAADPSRFPEVKKNELKIYVAGKVSKESVFGTHHWRDDFVAKLSELSGLSLVNLDPLKNDVDQGKPEDVFGADCRMIAEADVMVVYLSNDISVGGSQEILIAKYYEKPVIGLAPKGGKFNGGAKEMFGKIIDDYKDPFVFTTCDVVCDDIESVAKALENLHKIKPKTIKIIDELSLPAK